MPIAPQDGIDDWIAPAQARSAAEGLDDWIAPANAARDPYPDDWIHPDDWVAPAASPAPGAAPPAPSPRPAATGPGLSNHPVTPSDPLAAYWSLIPASRAGAMAWQPPIFLPPNPFSHENIPASKWLMPPPIFLNSPGRALSPPAAPPSLSSIPAGGLLGALANLPAADAPRSGLLDALANLPSAEPAAFPSFQPIGGASDDFDRSATPPLFQGLGDFPLSRPSVASGDSGNAGDGPAIEGNNTGQSSTLDGPPFTLPFKLLPEPSLPQANSKPTNSETSPSARQVTPPSGDSGWFATSLTAPNSVRSSEQSDAGDNSASRSATPPTDSNESSSITRVVRDPNGRALAIIHVQPAPSEASPSQSDATPDALRPGAKFAQINNAVTGKPVIDRTTDMLLSVLQESVRAMGVGAGARFGTAVHVDFANRVKKLDLPGIGQDGVEQSFRLDWKDLVYYGLVNTIRTDVTLRDPKDPRQRPIAVYDLKTGYAVLTPRRVKEIYDNVDSPGLLVIELQYRTGDAIDRTGIYPRR
jgi:hypothetical protein